jgi:hypothetical protein
MALSSQTIDMKLVVRDSLISLTLANFALLKDWRLLLGNMRYFSAPEFSRYLAIVFCSILFAAAFFFGIRLARSSGRVGHFLAKWLVIQLLVFGVCLMSTNYIPRALFLPTLILVPILLVAHPVVPRAIATLLVAISPCVMFLYVRGAWEVSRGVKSEVIQGSMSRLEAEGPRVLVVVFDALGENVPFTRRPEGVKVPAFDRLRSEAFVATAAYPPSNMTVFSMPALLTSKLVNEVKTTRGKLAVQYVHQDKFESLDDSRTIFSEVRDLGLGTAMIGWYHPYCFILRSVDFCAHVEFDNLDDRYKRGGFNAKVLDLYAGLPLLRDTKWGRQRSETRARDSHQHETSFLSEVTSESLLKFRSGLLIVHLPIPHPPALKGAYFSNLEQADAEVQRVRDIMERTGTWEQTTVVITSDHWWRTRGLDSHSDKFAWTGEELAYVNADKDKRVPFIVKLPGQNPPGTYTREFNTVILSKLIRESLEGKIRSNDELSSWLDLRRSDAPVDAYLRKGSR